MKPEWIGNNSGEILDELETGGNSEVYKVSDRKIGRDLALKLLRGVEEILTIREAHIARIGGAREDELARPGHGNLPKPDGCWTSRTQGSDELPRTCRMVKLD